MKSRFKLNSRTNSYILQNRVNMSAMNLQRSQYIA